MIAQLRLNQTEDVTLQEVRPWLEALLSNWRVDRGEKIISLLERLAQAAGGRHWRHTLADLAIMNALITGPQHPDWPQVTGPIAHRPDLTGWLDHHRQLIDPDLLRLFVLLHDVGKAVQLGGHEEISYRLLKEALGRDFAGGTEEVLLALAIRYHAVLGSIETGMASSLALLPLVEAIRHDPGQVEPLLAALILMAITEFAVYDSLDAVIMEGILARAEGLRRQEGLLQNLKSEMG